MILKVSVCCLMFEISTNLEKSLLGNTDLKYLTFRGIENNSLLNVLLPHSVQSIDAERLVQAGCLLIYQLKPTLEEQLTKLVEHLE